MSTVRCYAAAAAAAEALLMLYDYTNSDNKGRRYYSFHQRNHRPYSSLFHR